MATITIKGNTDKKKVIVDAFQDLCQIHSDLTQDEVLEMLMDTQKNANKNKDDATLYASLVARYVFGTEFETVDAFIVQCLLQMRSAREFEQKLVSMLSLESSQYPDILEHVEKLVEACKEKHVVAGLTENSNILNDIKDFKASQSAKELEVIEKLAELNMPEEDISPEEALDVACKFKIVWDYMKTKKPDITPKEVCLIVLDSVHDEIIATKQA
jgi:hypothetical protein